MHSPSLVGVGGFAGVQVAKAPVLPPVLPWAPVVPPPLVPPFDPAEEPSLRPVAVQLPLTQVPVQQSLSVVQAVPAPASALSGVQVKQSEEMSQPSGQVELQPFALAMLGEQPRLKASVAAVAPRRDRSPTFMWHILRDSRDSRDRIRRRQATQHYTDPMCSATYWSRNPLEMQAFPAKS
jgi:hypothetical protein